MTFLSFTMIVSVLVAGLSLASLVLAEAVAKRVHGSVELEKAAAVGEAGLLYIVEQWRRTSGGASASFLDYVDQNGDGRATTPEENAEIGRTRPLGNGGSFELLEIADAEVAPSVRGKVVLVRGVVGGVPYLWRALLSPNLVAPIQGVGTIGSQTWWGGAKFEALGGGCGTVFGNGNLTVSGNETIDGDVRMGGTVQQNGARPITGSVVQGAPPIDFPDQQAIINAVTEAVNDPKPPGFWKNPVTSLVVTRPLAAAEAINADATRLGSGWSNANTPNMRHMFLRGGAATLPAGNYAFGRLWLDGSTLVIKAPPGGGTLVLADLYLTNGARLVLDARDGPFTIVSPQNNAYYHASSVGSSGAVRWNGSGWVSGAPSLKVDGSSSAHVWNRTAGVGAGSNVPKPARGTTNGYDDWVIKNSSALAVVTADPTARGAELYMRSEVDFVLSNGARVMAGVQPNDLAALLNPASGLGALDALAQNAPGFLVWSGGAYLPRLNISAGHGASGLASSFTGLVYGAFEATIGPQGMLTGAFVGKTMNSKGRVRYDARLSKQLTGQDGDSHHVVVKFREG